MGGWIGVDLDGTLAHYHGWGDGSIGEPVPRMMRRVRDWLTLGQEVKIFTARANDPQEVVKIKQWLHDQDLPPLEITATKDYACMQIWDNRAVGVVPNTGERVDEFMHT